MSATGLRPAWQLSTRPALALPEPILGIRALQYQGEGRPGLLPAIAGLRIQVIGVVGARPAWDAVSGQTCFDDLPPGARRILVSDPERRYLPAALTVDIPSRHPARPTIASAPPMGPPPRRTVLLRPAPGRAIPAGMTAVIGRLRDAAGRGIALGRLACATGPQGRAATCITWTDGDGGFALLLPEGDPGARSCGLSVHVPLPALAAALARDPLGALPPDLDAHDPDQVSGLFMPRAVRPHAPDGQPSEAGPGQLPIRPGRTMRWDLVLA